MNIPLLLPSHMGFSGLVGEIIKHFRQKGFLLEIWNLCKSRETISRSSHQPEGPSVLYLPGEIHTPRASGYYGLEGANCCTDGLGDASGVQPCGFQTWDHPRRLASKSAGTSFTAAILGVHREGDQPVVSEELAGCQPPCPFPQAGQKTVANLIISRTPW